MSRSVAKDARSWLGGERKKDKPAKQKLHRHRFLCYTFPTWLHDQDGKEDEDEFERYDSTSLLRGPPASDLPLSSYAELVSPFRGDVKTSTYFLAQQRHPDPAIDFYITRAWLAGERVRTLVVFLKPHMWQDTDGETTQTSLADMEQVLPQPGRIQMRGQTVIVVDYDVWKEKMRVYQKENRNA